MMAIAEDELICDFAETYHIYDYQALSVEYAAVLAFGLSKSSRTWLKVTDQKQPTETLLLATIADCLSLLVWFQTEDAKDNVNRPASYVELLQGIEHYDNDSGICAFDTVEELDAALARFERR